MSLCECGCGGQAPLASQTNKRRGNIKGQPQKFILGHYGKGHSARFGCTNPAWRGGKYLDADGYVMILLPSHPRATMDGYVREHILIVEQILGLYLDARHEVHHVNEHTADNRNSNLVLCEDQAYHKLLHRRLRAYAATGSVLGIKCNKCNQWGLSTDRTMKTVYRASGHRNYSVHYFCNGESC